MNLFFRYILAASVFLPILLWFAYLVIIGPKVSDSAGGDILFLFWGAHLIVAYILNWKMFTVVVAIKPNKYSSFERICGLVLGVFFYGFFFLRLAIGE